MKNYELNHWSPAATKPDVIVGRGNSPDRHPTLPHTAATAMRAARYLLAAMLSLGLVLLSMSGLESPATASLVQATTLASGFVLLALAVDNNRGRAGYLFISGMAVLTMALLSRVFAAELVVMAVPVLALWLSAWLVKGSV